MALAAVAPSAPGSAAFERDGDLGLPTLLTERLRLVPSDLCSLRLRLKDKAAMEKRLGLHSSGTVLERVGMQPYREDGQYLWWKLANGGVRGTRPGISVLAGKPQIPGKKIPFHPERIPRSEPGLKGVMLPPRRSEVLIRR